MMAFPSRTRRVLDDIEPIPKQEARQWRSWRGRPTETVPARPPKAAEWPLAHIQRRSFVARRTTGRRNRGDGAGVDQVPRVSAPRPLTHPVGEGPRLRSRGFLYDDCSKWGFSGSRAADHDAILQDVVVIAPLPG
jgi:hypothetical protein